MTTEVERLVGCRHEFEAAGRALAAATEAAYPRGTRLFATLGNARILGEVTGSGGSWWHHPDYVTVRNLKTGKTRSFCATLDDHEISIVGRPTPNTSVQGAAKPSPLERDVGQEE